MTIYIIVKQKHVQFLQIQNVPSLNQIHFFKLKRFKRKQVGVHLCLQNFFCNRAVKKCMYVSVIPQLHFDKVQGI